MKMKALTFALSLTLAPTAFSYPNQPVFDCTREETLKYINQVTYTVFAPTQMTSPKAFEEAVVVQSQEAAEQGDFGGSSCVTVFTDGKLDDVWKDTIDSLRSLDFTPNFSSINGAAMQQFLNMAREKVMEEITSAVDALGKDICEMLSSDNLEDMIKEGIHEEFGWQPHELRMDNFVADLTEEMLLNADRDIVRLISDDEALADWMGASTRSELREARRELWENF